MRVYRDDEVMMPALDGGRAGRGLDAVGSSPHDALTRYFGFPAFRPGQQEALQFLLAGQDTLVVMPTGSGKSLIYQIAALVLPGTALVFSPLVALMKDQVDALTRRGIAATFINSSLDLAEQNRRLGALGRSEYKIVLVAPERLRSVAFRTALARVQLSLFVIDEAHCLSQWGHDFRPDYLHIAAARREFKPPVTLALTATATTQVQQDILRLLGLSDANKLVLGFNRPNLYLDVLYASDFKAKLEHVRDRIAAAEGAGIIYVGTRSDAEEVAEFVREVAGKPAQHYHAGLEPQARSMLQDAFLAGDLPLIVATNAFGMGIDRPDVRLVLHFSLPGTLEAYYQEAGRAGRDGLPARATLIYSPKDTALHESFIENAAPTAGELRAIHSFLSQHPETNLEAIERATGTPQVKTRVALEHLERTGILQSTPHDPFGGMSFQAAPLSDSALKEIARNIDALKRHKQALLRRIVAYAETNACRRRTILDYFGDLGPADAPMCCDNDLSRADAAQTEMRSAATDAEHAALFALEAIARSRWGFGKDKIVKLLKGSHSDKVQQYARDPSYGKLAAWRVRDLESLVTQLLTSGYLKQVGSDLPVLKLTPRGEHALQAGAAIQVDLRPPDLTAFRRTEAARAAGGTLELTAQLQARGLSPEQIAAERGLSPVTIYSHLGQLIAAGRVDVNAIIPADIQRQIHAAIQQVGSVQQLTPVKALLPEEIDYNIIRCVANAWTLERAPTPAATAEPTPARPVPATPASPTIENDALFGQLRTWRLDQARKDNVAPYVIFHDSVLHEIAKVRPKTRQEMAGIRGIGPAKLGKYSAAVLELVAGCAPASAPAQHAPATPASTPSAPTAPHSGDDVAAFLTRAHPRPLQGPWHAGWALDAHSRFDGDTANRSPVGAQVYRFKYGGELALASDLAAQWAQLLAQHPELDKPDAVVPVPPSVPRDSDPVAALARALAADLGLPVMAVLCKTRATRPQKEMNSLAQKQANVAGAFVVRGDVRGKRVVLIDDLYDSGATLNEAARVLTRAGAANIIVLTLTKTIHAHG